jgi:5'-deoxynucleotidase YfbR-like HD superfamily hydrolase
MAFFVVVPAVATYYGAATVGAAVLGAIGVTAASTAVVGAVGAGVIAGGFTALRGGDAGDIFKSAVLGGVSSYVGGTIGGEVSSAVRDAAVSSGSLSTAAATSVGKVVGSAVSGGLTSGASALLSGRDPIESFIRGGLTSAMSAGVGEAVNYAVKDVPGFGPPANATEAAFQRAAKAALATTIVSGGDLSKIAPTVLNSFMTSAGMAIGKELKDLSSNVQSANDQFRESEREYTSNLEQQESLVAQYNDAIKPVQDLYAEYEESKEDYDEIKAQLDAIGGGGARNVYSYLVSQGGRPTQKGIGYVRMPDGQVIGTVAYSDTILSKYNSSVNELNAKVNEVNDKYAELLGGEVTKYRTETQMQSQMVYGNDGNEIVQVPVEVQVPYTETVAGTLTPLKDQLETLKSDAAKLESDVVAKKDNLTTAIQQFQDAETQNTELASKNLNNLVAANDRYKAEFGKDLTEDLINKYVATGNVLTAVDADILQNQQASKSTSPTTEDAVVVPGAENVANLITGGGETVAGSGGFTPNFVAAMPEMQPREGEVAGDVQEVEPGIYKRTISKTLADGTVVSYDITYDPENTNRPISYDTASGDQTSGFNIVSSSTRPNFDQQEVETGVSTDTSGQVQAEAGAPVATEPTAPTEPATPTEPTAPVEPATPTEPAVAPVATEQPPGPSTEPSTTPPDALVPDASNPDLEAGKTPQERAAEEWKRYLDSLATKPADLNLPGSTIEAGPYFDEYNANLKRIMDEGGYTSQWQNANGDKVFVNDDGTAIGINQEGATYSLSDAQVEEMVSKGLLNTAESGYVDATGGTGNTPGGTAEDTTKDTEPENQCGEGFHFDEARGICIADTDTKEDEECPPGYVRNLNTGACELATTGAPNVRLNNLNGSNPVKNKVSVQSIPSSYFIPEPPIVSAPSINDDPIMQGALPSIPQETKFEGPLDQFLKLVTGSSFVPKQPEQNQQQVENMDTKLSYPQGGSDYFSYGQQSEIENNLYPKFGQNSDEQLEQDPQQFNRGGLAVPLMAAGGTRYGKYATGGLNIVHHSGKNRVDFRRGDAVTGPGDGQSDDIPAMLADGEFVFPADVVAALGNGSTKAGSDKLYEMMHAIRAHHRSAKPKDLPPPAKKSPLDYLKTRKARR